MLVCDGGGSKSHAAVVSTTGHVLGVGVGAGSNAQVIGLPRAREVLDTTVTAALEQAGDVTLVHAGLYLAGLDLPIETALMREALASTSWLPPDAEFANDIRALLRAGTAEPEAVAVVCGTGTNAIGVRADGVTATFPALGSITGDWGGGWHLGERALWHAARAQDGRGPRTELVTAIPARLGLDTLDAVIEALHFGRLQSGVLGRLSHTVLVTAEAGDSVAGAIVDRQASEIALYVRAALDRLGLREAALPVVLGGGVIASRNPFLLSAVAREVATVAPRARIEFVHARPILGAGLLALERIGAGPAALAQAATDLARID